jgi:hypothetical protein
LTESTRIATEIDVASFRLAPEAFAPIDVVLAIKSQDQIDRRRRLIEALRGGRIGRIEERPIAEGLVVAATLRPGQRVDRGSAALVRTHREPRGIALLDGGAMLVAEIDRVLHLDAMGKILREYRHPLFGFLHSVELSADRRRALVVSSGYDTVMELDLGTGVILWDWTSWEHGFNPGEDGIYLARSDVRFRELVEQGLPARLVEPERLGAHGLMTSARTNHPNSACYHPRDPGKVLATLGHSGDVIEIERPSGAWRRAVSGLAAMPHGIMARDDGWLVTDTLRGACWFLSANFELEQKLGFNRLPGKPAELAENEWLQSVHALGDGVLLGLDANRGLILVRPAERVYAVVPVDEQWCVHCCVSAVPHPRGTLGASR